MRLEHRSYRDDRRSERKRTVLEATCRKAGGLSQRGIIYDLTAEGCLVACGVWKAAVGQQVLIRPDGLDTVTGCIRWMKDGKAGIEFEKPLYGPVVEHLQMKHATIIEVVPAPKSSLKPTC